MLTKIMTNAKLLYMCIFLGKWPFNNPEGNKNFSQAGCIPHFLKLSASQTVLTFFHPNLLVSQISLKSFEQYAYPSGTCFNIP